MSKQNLSPNSENVGGNDSGVIRIDDQSNVRKSTRQAVIADNPIIQQQIKEKHAASIAAGKLRVQQLMEVARNNPTSPVMNESSTVNKKSPQKTHQNSVPPTLADLSQLVNVGRIEREVVVQGYKFAIHTLSNLENEQVFAAVAAITDEIKKLGTLRLAILSVAIRTINDVPLENLYEGADQDLTIQQMREQVIRAWQQIFTQAVFDEYSKIVEESTEMIGLKELKN